MEDILSTDTASKHYDFASRVSKHLPLHVQSLCALACNIDNTVVEAFILNVFDPLFFAHSADFPTDLVKHYNDALSNMSSSNPDTLEQYLTGQIFWQEYTAYVRAMGRRHYPVLEEVQFVAEISAQNITIHTSQDLGGTITYTPTPDDNGLRNMTTGAVFNVQHRELVFPNTSFEIRHTGAIHFEQIISDYKHSYYNL